MLYWQTYQYFHRPKLSPYRIQRYREMDELETAVEIGKAKADAEAADIAASDAKPEVAQLRAEAAAAIQKAEAEGEEGAAHSVRKVQPALCPSAWKPISSLRKCGGPTVIVSSL